MFLVSLVLLSVLGVVDQPIKEWLKKLQNAPHSGASQPQPVDPKPPASEGLGKSADLACNHNDDNLKSEPCGAASISYTVKQVGVRSGQPLVVEYRYPSAAEFQMTTRAAAALSRLAEEDNKPLYFKLWDLTVSTLTAILIFALGLFATVMFVRVCSRIGALSLTDVARWPSAPKAEEGEERRAPLLAAASVAAVPLLSGAALAAILGASAWARLQPSTLRDMPPELQRTLVALQQPVASDQVKRIDENFASLEDQLKRSTKEAAGAAQALTEVAKKQPEQLRQIAQEAAEAGAKGGARAGAEAAAAAAESLRQELNQHRAGIFTNASNIQAAENAIGAQGRTLASETKVLCEHQHLVSFLTGHRVRVIPDSDPELIPMSKFFADSDPCR
jgi:hypothetical protein